MSKLYNKIRVLIADDHEMVREGLQLMLSKIAEVEVIGEARDGIELIALTKQLMPDVILTDVKMPKINGIEVTKTIKRDLPHIGIVALSSFDEENLIIDMIEAGARGYLLKNAGKLEITAAIKAAFKDEPYYCNQPNQKLARMIAKGANHAKKKKTGHYFTPREIDVIERICNGLSSKQIAEDLGLTTRTVERYRDIIMTKMQVNNSAGVVMYAATYGLCKSSIKWD